MEKKAHGWYWSLFGLAGVIAACLTVLFLALAPTAFETLWEPRWLVFFATFIWFLASFRVVGADEVGAILFFGKPLEEVSSGLVFVPLFIFTLKLESRLIVQMELPANPEKIYHGSDPVVPDGFFPPMRVTFADARSAEKKTDNMDDPLNVRRVTAEVVPVVESQIEEGQFVDFIRNTGGFDELKQRLTDAVIGSFFQDLSKMTAAYALANAEEINSKLTKAVEAITEVQTTDGTTWGVKIRRAYLKAIPFHHDLNIAIAKPVESDFNAKAAEGERQVTVTKAKGDAEAITLTGTAEANVIRLKLEEEGKGLRVIAQEIADEKGELVLRAKTAQSLGASGNVVVVTGNHDASSGLLGLVAGASAVAKKTTEKKEEGK